MCQLGMRTIVRPQAEPAHRLESAEVVDTHGSRDVFGENITLAMCVDHLMHRISEQRMFEHL